MTFKFIPKLTLFALLGLTVFSSCTKEDSVTLVETEEEIQLQFKMTINGTEIVTDAVAAYCQNDSIEFIAIANKVENLDFPLNTQNFEEGDFTYYTSTSEGTTNWSLGGQALGEDITGFSGLTISFGESTITIESNDGDLVIGSSEGILLAMDDQGNFTEYPYTMDFTAEIVQESNFCE